jgi:DNA-binding response OmpR family regulator
MALNLVYLDDEEDLCSLFAEMFSSDEVKIKTFVDPELAIQEVSSNPPDLIFLDFRLPKVTGDMVALKMNNAIPKVLISGDISPITEYKFLKIFGKPWTVSEVENLILEFKNKK